MLKFIVSKSIIINIFRAHHDDMVLKQILRGIEQNFSFSSRKRVYKHIENCLTYIMANSSPNQWKDETHLISPSKIPLEILYIDYFRPLQESENNCKHILIVVDAFM